MVAFRLRLAALGLAATLFGGCEGGSYAVSIEYDWGSMTVSAWDADVPGCAALFPRAAGTRFAEEPPIPPECLDAIDESGAAPGLDHGDLHRSQAGPVEL